MIRKEFVAEQYELGISGNDDDVRIVLGEGSSVQHVLMPGEYRTIVMKGPLNEEWINNVIRKAESCGKITAGSMTKNFAASKLLFVIFCDPNDAIKAVDFIAKNVKNVTVEVYKWAGHHDFEGGVV